jgi:hypothetical protein
MTILLVILLVLLLVGAWPSFGWHQYGYTPVGLVGVLLIILVVLVLTGRL